MAVIERYSVDGIDFDIGAETEKGEIFLALISFDESRAIVGYSHECMEHNILLAKIGQPSTDIDRYFRIVFDKHGAEWTFVCPPDYKNISDKTRRIRAFYADGYGAISKFLAETGLCVEIKIPARYKRHVTAMSNGNGNTNY